MATLLYGYLHHEIATFKTNDYSFDTVEKEILLAGDQWWPHTSGGRLRFVRAITYLLRHRFGNFVKGNKRNLHKKTGKILCLGGEK